MKSNPNSDLNIVDRSVWLYELLIHTRVCQDKVLGVYSLDSDQLISRTSYVSNNFQPLGARMISQLQDTTNCHTKMYDVNKSSDYN